MNKTHGYTLTLSYQEVAEIVKKAMPSEPWPEKSKANVSVLAGSGVIEFSWKVEA